MKKKILFLLGSTLASLSVFSQSIPTPDDQEEGSVKPFLKIVFGYDDAGNQVYRGNNLAIVDPALEEVSAGKGVNVDDQFWSGINIYPVPVKDVLNISWNDDNNALIENVSLYQHNTMAFLFQQQNYPNLDRKVKIDMVRYYMGVYVLSFQLKDGRVMTRNIIKE